MFRLHHTLFPLVVFLATACGDEAVQGPPDTEPGTGGGPTDVQRIDTIAAPTETLVVVTLALAPDDSALETSRWTLDSPRGALAIEAIALGDDGRSIELTTGEQKLGVTYSLRYDDVEGALEAEVVAADTARFWVIDYGSPTFEQFEVVARREVVGTSAVIYVQQGEVMANAESIVEHFDEVVLPAETALFGEAPDRDDNGRVVLLGLDARGAYAGAFNPLDTHPEEESFATWGFHSNEHEMLYLNVETGSVPYAESVVPHELSHLLYQEIHHWTETYWPYHNEGLAECAVNAVNGSNPFALDFYVNDPFGDIAPGLSLVDWQDRNFSQYVQAFVFWSYLAGQLDGVESYATLMHQDADPTQLGMFLEDQLSISMPTAQLRMMLAAWAQQPDGEHSFNGVIALPSKPKTAGAPVVSLPPMTGAFLAPDATTFDPPAGKGPDVVFAGIDAAGVVDLSAPFDVAGGVVVVLNTETVGATTPAQPTGLMPFDVAADEPDRRGWAWLHAPPFNPHHLDAIRAWHARTRVR